MALEIQVWSINYTLVARICKINANNKSSIHWVLKSIKRFESHSTQQNIIFQQYYRSYCDYLLKMSPMDEEQAVYLNS